MPSSPNYVRNYQQEKRTSDARGEKVKRNERDRARYKLAKLGMVHKHDGKDVDHIKMLSKGGAPEAMSNLRVESEHKNRSFPRNPNGSAKHNG